MRNKTLTLFAAASVLLAGVAPTFATPCDFPAAKKAIDSVFDGDTAKFAVFRKRAEEGHDGLEVLDELVAPGDRANLRECRWEAGEYLTKRGFPPLH